MEGFAKRYFWVVNLAVLGVLAYLSARVVNNVVAGEIAALETKPSNAVEISASGPKGAGHTEDSASAIYNRNLFNANPPSDEPPVVEDTDSGVDEGPPVAGAPPGEGEECDKSDAPLTLVATMVSQPSDWSMAIVDDGQASDSRLMKESQQVADRTLVAIQRDRIVLANAGRFECVTLGERNVRGRRPTASNYAPSTKSEPAPSADLSKGIEKTGKDTYKIDRAVLDEQLADLGALSRQARVIPHYKGGKPDGFKIVGVRPGSLFSHIGVRSGDIIKAVSGEEISSPNKALELYERLKDSDNVTVEINRRGRPVTLEYQVK